MTKHPRTNKKSVKAWAVDMEDTFSLRNWAALVTWSSSRKEADEYAKRRNNFDSVFDWKEIVVPCTITFTLPTKTKK